MGEITYAKVGGPPAYWRDLKVTNRATGLEMRDVLEVDAAEGWLVRAKRDARGLLVAGMGEVQRERITGRFRIEQRGSD